MARHPQPSQVHLPKPFDPLGLATTVAALAQARYSVLASGDSGNEPRLATHE